MEIKKIYIKGMHCASCEKLLEDEFKNIKGISSVSVDCKKNIATIGYVALLDFPEIKKIAQKFGYDAFENSPAPENIKKRFNRSEWVWAFGILLLFLFGYRAFRNLGLADLIGKNNANLTFGVAFLVGVAASLSSCLAVVGAVIIAFSEKHKIAGKTFWTRAVKPNALFHAGRVGIFFLLGGLLGIIGGEINISLGAIAVYTIIISLVMAWLGLNILGFVPSLSKMGISFPKKITKHWKRIENSEHSLAPLILGGLSFFLPCGFTQSMQIFALTTGSFLGGGLTLAIFALGTMPVLLGVGVATSWTKNKKWGVFQKVAGVLIITFSVYTFSSGLAIRGASNNIFSNAPKSEKDNQKTDSLGIKKEGQSTNLGLQEIQMAVTSRGFSPNVIKLKQSVPVRWVIDGKNISGCTNKIIVPSLGIQKELSYDKTIVEFTPSQKGVVPFSCWMGMVRGKFIVE